MKTTPVEGVVGAGLPASRRPLEGRRRIVAVSPVLHSDLPSEYLAQVVRDPCESPEGDLSPIRQSAGRLRTSSHLSEGLLDHVGQVVWVAHEHLL